MNTTISSYKEYKEYENWANERKGSDNNIWQTASTKLKSNNDFPRVQFSVGSGSGQFAVYG